MAARRSRRILLHERHRQWELELLPDKEDEEDEVLRGLDWFRKRVVNTVSAIFKATALQLETLAKQQRRPIPDAWSIFGARDRFLTPRSHPLGVAEPVEARMMLGSGDNQPALRITGLSTSSVTQDTSLIFVFMPMSSFFTLPDTACTLSDLTSKVFVPVTEEQEEAFIALQGTEEDSVRLTERKEEEEQQQTRQLVAKEEALNVREGDLNAVAEQQQVREEQQTAREEQQQVREEQQTAREEEQRTRETEQNAREEEQAETQRLMEEKEHQQQVREEELNERDKQHQADVAALQEKEEQLSQQNKLLEETEQRQKETEQQQEEREARLGEEQKVLEEKQEYLDDREKALNDKEQQVVEKDSELSGREERINEEQAVLEEKQEQSRQHEEALDQREQTLQQETEVVREREQKVGEEEQRLQEWEQRTQEKEETLKRTEQQLEEFRCTLADEEERLNEREKALSESEAELAERNGMLDDKEKALTEKEKTLAEENERLQNKSEELQEEEKRLAEKEKSLNELEESLNQRKAQLEEAEERLKARETHLQELEEKQRDREARNRDTEERLAVRAQELDECEERHRQWEIRSREEKEVIAERQRALQELEVMLKDWERRSQEEEEKLKAEERRIKSEEERLQERERSIEEEEKRQEGWKQNLQEEGKRQKAYAQRLEEEEQRQKKWRRNLEQEEDRQGEVKQRLGEEESKQRETAHKLTETERLRRPAGRPKAAKKTSLDDGWTVCSSNSRFEIRQVEEPFTMVDKSVSTEPGPKSWGRSHRRSRSMPPMARSSSPDPCPGSTASSSPGPNAESTASSVASVLTEDDVIMVSSYKGEKATIVETYDIKYLREEIFDVARESVSTHGITRPGRGVKKSHESESFVLSAAETGRGSASPRSSSTSSQRSATPSTSTQSHISMEPGTQAHDLNTCGPDNEVVSPPAEGTRANVSQESGSKGRHGTSPVGSRQDSALCDYPSKKSVSFNDEGSDQTHSRSPPVFTDGQRCLSPKITFSRESQGASSKLEVNIQSETEEAAGVKDAPLENTPGHGGLSVNVPGDVEIRKPSPSLSLLPSAQRSTSPKRLDLPSQTSPNLRFLDSVAEQIDTEKEDFEGKQRVVPFLDPKESKHKTKVSSKPDRKAPKKDDGYSLERTDPTSTSEESSDSCEPSPDISIDCVSPKMASWLNAAADQSPNDIIIDVTREPVKQISPASSSTDGAYWETTTEASSLRQTDLNETVKAQGEQVGVGSGASKQEEKGPLNDTRTSPSPVLPMVKALSLEASEEMVEATLEASGEMVEATLEASEEMVEATLEASEGMVEVTLEASEEMIEATLEASEGMVEVTLEASEEMVEATLEASEEMVEATLEASEEMAEAATPREQSMQAFREQIPPSADEHSEPCLELSAGSKSVEQNDSFERQLEDDQQLSPSYNESPDSSPPQHRSSHIQKPKQASPLLLSRTSASPTSPNRAPLPREIPSKTPSPRPGRHIQVEEAPSISSPLESITALGTTGNSTVKSPHLSPLRESSITSPTRADGVHATHATSSPVPEMESQSPSVEMKVQPGSQLCSDSSTTPEIKSRNISPRAKSVSGSTSPTESILAPQHKTSTQSSPRPSPDQLKSPAPSCKEQGLPPFLMKLAQTLEKVQLQSMETLQSHLSRMSSPSASPNVSPTSPRKSSYSPLPSKSTSPSVGALTNRSSKSPSQEQCKSVNLEQDIEGRLSSPAVFTRSRSFSPMETSPSSPVQLSSPPKVDLVSNKQAQSKSSSHVRRKSPCSRSPSSGGENDMAKSSPAASEKSAPSRSPPPDRDRAPGVHFSPENKQSLSATCSSVIHSEAKSVRSSAVTSQKSPCLTKAAIKSADASRSPLPISRLPQATPEMSKLPLPSPLTSGSPRSSPSLSASTRSTPLTLRSPHLSPVQCSPTMDSKFTMMLSPKLLAKASDQTNLRSTGKSSESKVSPAWAKSNRPPSQSSGSPELPSKDASPSSTARKFGTPPVDIEPCQSPAGSSLSKLPVPLPQLPAQLSLQSSPQTKQSKTSENISDSSSVVGKSPIASDTPMVDTFDSKATHTQNPECLLPSSGSPKSKLQALVARFEHQASKTSGALASDLPEFQSPSNLQQKALRPDGKSKLTHQLTQEKHESNLMPVVDMKTGSVKEQLTKPSQPGNETDLSTPLLTQQIKTPSPVPSSVSHTEPQAQKSPAGLRPADSITTKLPPPAKRQSKREDKAMSRTSKIMDTVTSSPTSVCASHASVISQISSSQGQSPRLKPPSAVQCSPLQGSPLADMVAAQRMKAASPKPVVQTKAVSNSTLSSGQPKGSVPFSTAEPKATADDNTGQLLSAAMASLAGTPFHASMPPASSPLLSQAAPYIPSTMNMSSSDLSSVQNSREGSRSVSPSRSLISTALKTNGAANLRNMLAKQRKASYEREKTQFRATKVSQNVQFKETELSRLKDRVEGSRIPQEHVTTSVCQKRVDRDGQPPSSVVTITHKKVSYSKERVTDDTHPSVPYSPPVLSSVPVSTQGPVHHPVAVLAGQAKSDEHTDPSGTAARLPTSLTGYASVKKLGTSVKSDKYRPGTALVQNSRHPVNAERLAHVKRPLSDSSRSKIPSQSPSSKQKLDLLRFMMNSDAQQERESEADMKRLPHVKARMSPMREGKEQQPSSGRPYEQRSPGLSPKPSEPSDIKHFSSSRFKTQQMEERETLLRRRTQAKKLYEARNKLRKQSTTMVGHSEDSDFSDFFREYQTECQRKGISPDTSPMTRIAQVVSHQSPEDTFGKQEQHSSLKNYLTPVPASPPVKRRALEAYDGTGTAEQSRHGDLRQTAGPSNTCNSSPIKRSKRYERSRFLAYSTSPPTRTSPGALRNQSELPTAVGSPVNRNILALPVGAALDRNLTPIAFSAQMQTHRHQQGVVGDSIEMMDVTRAGRSGEFQSEESPLTTREKRRKQGRRVSWNDNQSSAVADQSHNQNAAVSSETQMAEGKSGLTTDSHRKYDVDDQHIHEPGDEPSLTNKTMQNDRLSSLQIDNGNDSDAGLFSLNGEVEPQRNVRGVTTDAPQRTRNSSYTSPIPGDSQQNTQLRCQATKANYTVSRSFTDHSQFNSTSVSTKEGTEESFPTAIHFSREQRKRTEYRPVGGTSTKFAKEEESRRKEFTSTASPGSINMAHKQSLRKSYTMHNQHKRAVITEERQQTREYIFKKNPYTARFPEHTGLHEGQYCQGEKSSFDMNTQNKLSKASYIPKAQPREMISTAQKVNVADGSQHEGTLQQSRFPCATNNNNLSLCEELRNAGFSPGEIRGSVEVDDYTIEGDSVDLIDYGDVDRWLGSVDPHLYQYNRSHILDLNESANSSALAGQGDVSSPEEKVFFTPQVVMGDRKVMGELMCVCLTGSPDAGNTVFKMQDPLSHTLPATDQHDVRGTIYTPSGHMDDDCSSFYFSIPCTESASLSAEAGSSHCRPLPKRQRRQYKRCNGNKNNSGDDHPKFPAQFNTAREVDHVGHSNTLEASACGGGDQGESTEQKPSDERVDKGRDYHVISRNKNMIVRRRRSFGRTYLSRLLAKRNYTQSDNQDLSDNCAHGQSSLLQLGERVCEAECCLYPEASHLPVADSVEPSYSECDCHDSHRKFCQCTGEAASCQHTFYDEDDRGDEEDEDVDDCQNKCEECGCSVDFSVDLALEDQNLIPHAFSQLWKSPLHFDPYENFDNLAMAVQHDTAAKLNRYQENEVEGHCAGGSLPATYTGDCKYAHGYDPGRGDGDVLPASRKEEKNYNMSRCQREEHRRRANYVFSHNQENKDKAKEDDKEKEWLKLNLNEEKHGEVKRGEVKEEGAGNHTQRLHHHHLCPHSEDDQSAHVKSSAADPLPAEANDDPNTSSPKDSHFSVTESMVQAYGYNPLTQSPFSARGYPQLVMDTSTLDHISLPFVKRKAVVFLRTDKEEFVEVGRGTYGCVYLAQATTRRGTTKVVVKDFFTDSSSWDLIVHEARMLCYLQDTGVIPHFYGLLKRRSHGDDFSLIQQYFAQGRTLHTVLVNKEQLEPETWQDVAWQLARGLLLIHEHHVLLNDLKGDNVLIDLRRERKIIKYIDLGMATYRKGLNFHLPEDQMSKFNFLSPEVRAGAYTSPMSDVYSLGYLLDQINRLAHLHMLKEVSSRCMDDLPVDRPHLADVVHVLTSDLDLLPEGASYQS